jgi:mono/diheme cytochrome c family protein
MGRLRGLIYAVALLSLGGAVFSLAAVSKPARHHQRADRELTRAQRLVNEGRHVFREDTFGDQAFWGGTLGLHKAIEGARHGGVGPGVSPKTALAVGLKVDATRIPPAVARAIKAGKVNLDDPATTLALLKLDAVVGVRAQFARGGTRLKSVGITCAVCHSTVDDSFAPGIGRRLDGWPNRDLNVGAIVGLSPNLQPVADELGADVATVKKVLASWGPGKFDAELFTDGKAFQPDGRSGATLIPPAFGLAGVDRHTYEGWGSIPYWNAFVANLEMHGQGNFTDSRLDDADKFPVAARNHLGHVHHARDLITPKLPALHAYELSLRAPKPPKGSFNAHRAALGKKIFEGKGTCASCHVKPTFTDPGFNMHRPQEICTDDFQASRGPDGMYRTTPLRGLWTHTKGGFYHDGRFQTLRAVVNHYDGCFGLHLSHSEKSDLVQYLKSL